MEKKKTDAQLLLPPPPPPPPPPGCWRGECVMERGREEGGGGEGWGSQALAAAAYSWRQHSPTADALNLSTLFPKT